MCAPFYRRGGLEDMCFTSKPESAGDRRKALLFIGPLLGVVEATCILKIFVFSLFCFFHPHVFGDGRFSFLPSSSGLVIWLGGSWITIIRGRFSFLRLADDWKCSFRGFKMLFRGFISSFFFLVLFEMKNKERNFDVYLSNFEALWQGQIKL